MTVAGRHLSSKACAEKGLSVHPSFPLQLSEKARFRRDLMQLRTIFHHSSANRKEFENLDMHGLRVLL